MMALNFDVQKFGASSPYGETSMDTAMCHLVVIAFDFPVREPNPSGKRRDTRG